MDLIEYLTTYKNAFDKSKGKKELGKTKGSIKPTGSSASLVRKKTTKKKKDRIPRRARGFGQRHRVYRENKNKSSEFDKQLLVLLSSLVKQNQPQQPAEALNSFIERDRQTYSMTFEPKVKSFEERLAKVETKAIDMGEEVESKSFLDKQNQLASINNKFVDYQEKWNELKENQESLNQMLSDINVGNVNENAQEEFRMDNVKVKEDILSLQYDLQENLNEASDLNDYKQFIDFQKQVLEPSINNYVAVDNRLTKELVKGKEKLTQEAIRLDEEQKGFEILQEQTFNEKREVQKQNDLLNLELVKSQEKESNLMDEMNSITSQFSKLQEKVYQMETNPEKAKNPKRVEIEELPKPKPSEEELLAKKDKKEALRLGREQMEEKKQAKERQNKKDTDELVKLVKDKKVFSPTLKEAFERLFGEEELKKVKALGGSSAPKLRSIKQLLETKRDVEF